MSARALTFQSLVEICESSLSQRPEHSEAFCWLVLVGSQHLQVLERRQDTLLRKSLTPSHHNATANEPAATLLVGLSVPQDQGSCTEPWAVQPAEEQLLEWHRAEAPAPQEGPSGEARSCARAPNPSSEGAELPAPCSAGQQPNHSRSHHPFGCSLQRSRTSETLIPVPQLPICVLLLREQQSGSTSFG